MSKKDLIVLAADKDMEHALTGLLARPAALGIRSIKTDVLVHPRHDAACAQRGVPFLAGFSNQYEYGLLMFDHKGSGKENISSRDLQTQINEEFARSTWGMRAKAIVLSPELESWIWSDSPHVDDVAGWKNRKPPLRQWLADQGWLQKNEVKPRQPKEAFRAALREAQTPRSASLYKQIAEKVSLHKCSDTAFREFKSILQRWFPEG